MELAQRPAPAAFEVPFAEAMGLKIVEANATRGIVTLPCSPRMANHVGRQHAGALFTVAESASCVAAMGRFGDAFRRSAPVVMNASIQYKRMTREAVTATAAVRDLREAVLSRLALDGEAEFDVDIVLADVAAGLVATMEVRWRLKQSQNA